MSRLALALVLGAVAGALAAAQPISDTDMWWHLATGRETLAHGFVRTDVFSWTVRGAPVTTDQWLGQVVMWLAYSALGPLWRGVVMLRVALAIALVAFVALAASRRHARPLAVVLATVPALLLTRAITVDRPELFGFTLFAALLLLLAHGRDGSRAALAGAVVLVALWTNVHGSFALGVVLTLAVCAEGALGDAPRRRAYVACALAAVAVTLVNPAGIGVWTAPGSHLLAPPRDVQEWNVIDPRTPLGAAYAATLALVIACVFLGPRRPVRELVILVPVAFLSLTAARQAPLLAIAAAPLFAERASPLIERMLRGRAAGATGAAPAGGVLRAGALGASAVLALAVLLLGPAAPDERAYPRPVLASIPIGDGTLARYEWGGWLIWNGVPVFVDGRLTPYRGAILDDYRRIVAAGTGWEDAVRRRQVRTLLVAVGDPVAARAMELGWSVRALQDGFVVISVP